MKVGYLVCTVLSLHWSEQSFLNICSAWYHVSSVCRTEPACYGLSWLPDPSRSTRIISYLSDLKLLDGLCEVLDMQVGVWSRKREVKDRTIVLVTRCLSSARTRRVVLPQALRGGQGVMWIQLVCQIFLLLFNVWCCKFLYNVGKNLFYNLELWRSFDFQLWCTKSGIFNLHVSKPLDSHPSLVSMAVCADVAWKSPFYTLKLLRSFDFQPRSPLRCGGARRRRCARASAP